MKKKIAIIGAGLTGLAAADRLSSKYQVVVFEKKGVGAGASGASAGLLHPYAGEKGRKSWQADAAMQASKELIRRAEAVAGIPLANFNGIIKEGLCVGAGEDVVALQSSRFLITSGITVFVDLYLKALHELCVLQKVIFEKRCIDHLNDLQEYDAIIVAAGAGIFQFAENRDLNINRVKGQAVRCELKEPLERSVTNKNYIALSSLPNICYIGSTYEREFTSEEPCLQTALELLKPSFPVLEVRAGIRVTNRAHYFPILKKVNKKTWIVTAMGSRGLLYHAYFANLLVDEIEI